MKPLSPTATDAEFRSVLSSSCGIALLGIIAAVASLKITEAEGFHFDWNWTTLLWLALGALFNWQFWRTVWQVTDHPTRGARVKMGAWLAAFIAAGLFGFLYPLRFLAKSKLPEISFGLVIAILFLGGIGFAMFMAARGLNRADEVELSRQRREEG